MLKNLKVAAFKLQYLHKIYSIFLINTTSQLRHFLVKQALTFVEIKEN